jgi:hypothetical protein
VTSIFDETLLMRPEGLEEQRFSLSRKGGKLSLRAKSPLFEDIFRKLSKGLHSSGSHPLWGVPTYSLSIDPTLENELNYAGCTMRAIDGFWRDNSKAAQQAYGGIMPGYPPYQFNLTFLWAKGLSEGLTFFLRDQIPLSLIEGPSYTFATSLRKGIYTVAKHLAFDFESTVVMQTSTKIGETL